MKKTALVILPVFAVLILASCTMRMPDSIKTENAVRYYLDSIYKDERVEIKKATDFMPIKNHIEQEEEWAYKRDSDFFKRHPDMSEKNRIQAKKITDDYYADEINYQKGYWIHCLYKINSKNYEDDFWVKPDFKTVRRIIIVE